jgi:hypothetical protein
MSDISKINVEGVDYDVKDVVARTEVIPIERGGTGAVDNVSGITSLLNRKTIDGTVNPTDLNTLITTGLYKLTFHTDEVATANNSPVKYGMLLVLNADGYITQLCVDHNNKLYTRTSINRGSEWYGWLMYSGTTVSI